MGITSIPNNSIPIIQMDLDGNFIAEFPNSRQAAKQFGGTNSKMAVIYQKATYGRRLNPTSTVSSKRKQRLKYKNEAYGYLWKIKRDEDKGENMP